MPKKAPKKDTIFNYLNNRFLSAYLDRARVLHSPAYRSIWRASVQSTDNVRQRPIAGETGRLIDTDVTYVLDYEFVRFGILIVWILLH